MSSINFYQGQIDRLESITEEFKNKEATQDSASNTFNNKSEDERKIDCISEHILEFFNVKNVHFLFGSGTSCNAIPNMSGLFKKVEQAIIDKDDILVTLEFEKIRKRPNAENNLEEILGLLYSHRSYLGVDNNPGSQYEICINLIEIVEEIIFNSINVDCNSKDIEVEKVFKNYRRFYQKLALRNKDLSRINIFTTNNDLFNESALDSLNVHYINGFGGGLNKFFNPALFNYTFSKRMDTSIEKFEPVENMVYLYKLHGSVNWIEDDSKQNTFFNIREVSKPERTPDKNVLVYPAPTKQNKSLGSPYVELFREFQKKLLEPNSTVFIVGYSFSDEHVNNILYQALAVNSTINIVILNNVEGNKISQINDNRIFRIWGEKDGTDSTENIHFFDFIVNNLLPDLDASKHQDKTLEDFIDFYKQNLS